MNILVNGDTKTLSIDCDGDNSTIKICRRTTNDKAKSVYIGNFGTTELGTGTYINMACRLLQITTGDGLQIDGQYISCNDIYPNGDASKLLGSSIKRWNYIYGVNLNATTLNVSNINLNGQTTFEPSLTKGNFTSSSPLTITNGNNVVIGSGTSISISQATATTDGYLTKEDWTLFNSKQVTLQPATGTTNGYLTSIDWNIFNNKQNAISNTSSINLLTLNVGNQTPKSDITISSTKNALTDVGKLSNYHLCLARTNADDGAGCGIAFTNTYDPYAERNVGASIIFKRTASNVRGELQIYTKSNATEGTLPEHRITISNVGITPSTNYSLSLGTSSLQWSNIYVANANTNRLYTNYIQRVEAGDLVIENTNGSVHLTSSSYNIFMDSITNTDSVVPKQNEVYDLGAIGNRYNNLFSKFIACHQIGAYVYVDISDRRQKENIEPLGKGIEFIKKLEPKKFKFKGYTETQYGFIAQDAELIDEDNVLVQKPDTEDEEYTMNYKAIIPILVKAMQEQQKKIEELEKKINILSM